MSELQSTLNLLFDYMIFDDRKDSLTFTRGFGLCLKRTSKKGELTTRQLIHWSLQDWLDLQLSQTKPRLRYRERYIIELVLTLLAVEFGAIPSLIDAPN
jgi:hypothetical protein